MIKHLYIAAFVLISSTEVFADYCPKTVGMLANDDAYERLVKEFTFVYEQLGCKVIVKPLPNMRSIPAFNNYVIDGEMARLQVIEYKYKIPFIRSAPLFSVKLGHWGQENDDVNVVGYLRGIEWQQKIINKYEKIYSSVYGFNKLEDMFKAYQRSVISSFLAEDQSIILSGILDIKKLPLLNNYLEADVYHYLNADYAAFMSDFNNYLNRNNSFSFMK